MIQHSSAGIGESVHHMPAALPGSSRPVRVFLADDHPIVLWGLRLLIDSEPRRVTLAGTASQRAELLSHPALAETDVLLLDVHLQGESSLDMVPDLIAAHGLKIVILTGDTDPRRHQEAVMRGALGIVLKNRPSTHVLDAIDRVHAGEVWLEGSLMAQLFARSSAAPSRSPQDEHARRIATLTTKEREVIAALVKHRGAKSLVVAETLGISEHTLRNRLTFIYHKLKVHGRLNLYLYAKEHELDAAGDDAAMAAAQRGGLLPEGRPRLA